MFSKNNYMKLMGRSCHENLVESAMIRVSDSSKNCQALFNNLAVNSAWILKCLNILGHYTLTLSWRRSPSCRKQSINLQSNSMDWFLYDRDLRHERVKGLKTMEWTRHFFLQPPNVLFAEQLSGYHFLKQMQ